MPELPEVETLVRQLAPLAKGRHVRQFEIIDTKLSVERPDSIHDMRIVSVMRLGKQIVIGLADPGRRAKRRWLAVHLRMTGRLIWSKAPETNPPRKLRARLRLDRGYLLFQDTRRFGTMRLADTIEAFAPAGLDPMSSQFNARALAERLAGARQSIKSWLLRQDRLAGLGNIYACEALHAARLSPWRPAGSLTRADTPR
ncbi:MAG: hypothetical protein M1457_14475, partial [bacterium]|nr:hypothetical protein [bacterium]